MWDYSDKVYDHFLHPRNVGEIPDPDAVGEVGNITCGDALRLTLRIDEKDKRIVDAKFKTFGCGSAIAAASFTTEMLIGRTIDQARELRNSYISEQLELPPAKAHCSVMAEDAVKAAIEDWCRKRRAEPCEGKPPCPSR